MDYTLGDTIYYAFTTRAFATGVPTALAGSPTLEIYENDSTSPIVEGASKLVLTQNLASINGFNLATITATSGNGFEAGKTYHIIIKTGTVGGTSVVGEVVGRFTLNASSALKPTVAGRTLDVSAGGEAGVDWANVGTPDSTVNLSATTVNLCNTITTYTGNTVQTGDSFARIGANGVGLTSVALADATSDAVIADAVWNAATASYGSAGSYGLLIETDLDAAISSRMATYTQPTGFLAATFPTTVASTTNITAAAGCRLSATGVDDIWDEPLAAHTTADTPGQVVNMLTQDAVTLSTDVALGSIVGQMLDNGTAWSYDRTTDSQEALSNYVDDIGTAGAGLTAIPWNASWDAEVESEVNDAIDTAIAELGVGAPTATPTLRTGMMLMYMALRNKLVTQTSGTDALQIYNDAGTMIAKKLLTDDGSDYTESEMVSG